ncbi:MAG TPA: tripartite tricarboxylate transporter substrate-binding protein [Verrucomicrobiae bacterium]|nr:tripartite tricarboxylate transporter substrate-binding protein [Verrucomicrobiae bacterium]
MFRLLTGAALAGFMLAGSDTIAAAAEEPYYKGKTIRFVVGFTPGGGHDLYTRLMAKYIGKHIPGNPSALVQNMPGGGSMIAANHIYKVAKPDGLTIGKWASGLIRQELMGRKDIEFESRKFAWVGAPGQDHLVCTVARASGFNSWRDVMATPPGKPLIFGGIAPGTSLSDDPRLLQGALKFPMNLVEGYKGSADVRRAAEAGEVHGGCWGWDAVRVTWKDALAAKTAHVLVQVMPTKHKELTEVPTAFEFAKTDEARQLLEISANGGRLLRNYGMSPGTPKPLLETIRKGFSATMKDAEFMAAAEKAGLEVDPLTGEEVERLVFDLFKTPPPVVETLKRVLLPK